MLDYKKKKITRYMYDFLVSFIRIPATFISSFFFFFFNDTATTEIYTLSLHDALPIPRSNRHRSATSSVASHSLGRSANTARISRSEEHTSELQSRGHLVCRLLLE